MNAPINSQAFWDRQFADGCWERVGGPHQTRAFAEAQVRRLGLPPDFSGTLVDFGCGLGDAFPVYRRTWPGARLIGVDFSAAAIARCRERYGELAAFVQGEHAAVPCADVIVASNVLEHLAQDQTVAQALARRCRVLYVIVPYREQYLIDEHRRAYDRGAFPGLACQSLRVFACRGWSQYGWRALWWEIRAKNLLRPWFGRVPVRRRLQVLYRLGGTWDGGRCP